MHTSVYIERGLKPATTYLNPTLIGELSRHVSCRHMAERIPIPELQKKLKGGKLVLVDVREASEIKESGAIPGAIHIPMAQVEKRMGELPKNAGIVFY